MPTPPNILIAASRRSSHTHFSHGAMVVRGGRFVSVGHNHGNIHAEVAALNKLWPNKRKGTKVWSIRTTKTGKLAMAKPCDECEKYLLDNGVSTVYYSTSSGEIKMMRAKSGKFVEVN